MNSDKSLEYVPQNKSYKFKTHLSAALVLEGTWRVAFVEADIVCTTSRTDAIYLYSDIVGSTSWKVNVDIFCVDYHPPLLAIG